MRSFLIFAQFSNRDMSRGSRYGGLSSHFRNSCSGIAELSTNNTWPGEMSISSSVLKEAINSWIRFQYLR